LRLSSPLFELRQHQRATPRFGTPCPSDELEAAFDLAADVFGELTHRRADIRQIEVTK
jgi:hypothetical protein